MVADRKFTVDYGDNFIYDDKIFGEMAGNVMVGFSGDRGAFEIFKATLEASLEEKRRILTNGILPTQTFILETSENIAKINNRFRGEHFDALVSISTVGGEKMLCYFYPDGRLETINTFKMIGSGSAYGTVFFKERWLPSLTMVQVEELAIFVIRYIERLQLTHTVGIDSNSPQVSLSYNPGKIADFHGEDFDDALMKMVADADKKVDDFKKYLNIAFPFPKVNDPAASR
jgi:hypothetical protein